MRYLLDFAIAYTPFDGFGKISELFKIPQKLDRQFPDDPGIDLRLNALHSLQRYFPALPIGLTPVHEQRLYTSKAFERYLDILWTHVKYPEYAGYVARIFMELKVLSVGDSLMRQVIKEQPRVLSGMLKFLLQSRHELALERDVPALYELCLQLQAEGAFNMDEEFRSQLLQLNGQLIDINDPPIIIIWSVPLLSVFGKYQDHAKNLLLILARIPGMLGLVLTGVGTLLDAVVKDEMDEETLLRADNPLPLPDSRIPSK